TVDADDVRALDDEAFAYIAAEKSGAARHEHALADARLDRYPVIHGLLLRRTSPGAGQRALRRTRARCLRRRRGAVPARAVAAPLMSTKRHDRRFDCAAFPVDAGPTHASPVR